MKKTLCFVMSLIMLSAMCVLASAEAVMGDLKEGGAIVIRFDSPKEIARNIHSVYGVTPSYLGGCLQLRPYCAPGLIHVQLSNENHFSADEYKYMKIKSFCKSLYKSTTMYFSTEADDQFDGAKAMTLQRGKGSKWSEKVYSVSSLSPSWEGMITGVRFDFFANVSKNAEEYMFIEYIAFFRTEEEAEAFEPITDEQKNGEDIISRYANGYRSSRFDGIEYEVPGEKREYTLGAAHKNDDTGAVTDAGNNKTVRRAITNEQILIIAVAVILGGGAITVFALLNKPSKEGKEDEE